MEDTATGLSPLQRLPTRVPGLDEVIGGGLFRGGVYMVVGRPGGGKTTLASQICFARAAEGESVLYVTLLTESHGRLLANLQGFGFFDAARVGKEMHFVNGYNAIEQEGLEGLLRLLRQTMRERKAQVLVIDGMVTVEALASSSTAYKKFIQELQTWAGLVGCTVLVLTSAANDPVGPEHTMVDGILELSMLRLGMRAVRQLVVTKFRGCSYLEGSHTYRITHQGIAVYPRFEALYAGDQDGPPPPERVATGVPGLDDQLSGGLPAQSLTLVLGPSGAGKTLLGMQFLAEGAARAERGIHFGFFETPKVLEQKAKRFDIKVGGQESKGNVRIAWQPMAEALLDELGQRLLRLVDEVKAKRLFIDGLVGFRQATAENDRMGTFFAILAEQLRKRGVTTLVSEELRQLLVPSDVTVPMPGISASFENILFLRQVESQGKLVHLLSVVKTRDSDHAGRIATLDITDHGMCLGEAIQTEALSPPSEKISPRTRRKRQNPPRKSTKRSKQRR